MKVLEVREYTLRHGPNIIPVLDDFAARGVPIGDVQVLPGTCGILAVRLNDTCPGWRSKDRNPLRDALRRELRKVAPGVEIKIVANYSCLAVSGDRIERRDDQGRIIGTHTF